MRCLVSIGGRKLDRLRNDRTEDILILKKKKKKKLSYDWPCVNLIYKLTGIYCWSTRFVYEFKIFFMRIKYNKDIYQFNVLN
jgi:hypothetical protein